MDEPLEVASRLLKKLAMDGSTEEGREELMAQLAKMPGKLFNYRLCQMMTEKDRLTEETERVVEYRRVILSTMTVVHFRLLNELLRWLKKEQQYVDMMAPSLFYFRRNSQERLSFLLKYDCFLSSEEEKTLPSLELLKKKFGFCLEEMSQRWNKTTVQSGGDQLTTSEDFNKEPKKKESIEEVLRKEMRMEAFEKITSLDGTIAFNRRETNIWHKSSVLSRMSYFEQKYNSSQ